MYEVRGKVLIFTGIYLSTFRGGRGTPIWPTGGGDTSRSRLDGGTPLGIPYREIERQSSYAAGSMPLAFTQEDFLVHTEASFQHCLFNRYIFTVIEEVPVHLTVLVPPGTGLQCQGIFTVSMTSSLEHKPEDTTHYFFFIVLLHIL